MCAIAGIMNFSEEEPAMEALKKMTDAMIHRGPDHAGYWTAPGIGLGFRKLSGHQQIEQSRPLTNEDGQIAIVFDGAIYNHQALRADLMNRGHQFKTESDAEVIVHLYEEDGEDCVKHLRGMFSFAIWDARQRVLFGARDYFGIKPFYYMDQNKRFIFASEIKGLIQAEGVEKRINEDSLLNYLTFQYVPEPMTMFEGISKLPPAHTITLSAMGRMEIRRYWDPMFEPVELPLEQYVEKIREKLKESVKLHIQTDLQRGCFLSSGIDSTSIASHMRLFEPTKSFSVGFEGARNETEIAKETAAVIGTEHYDRVISEEAYFASLAKAVWHQEDPVADPSAIALYHLSQLAKEHVSIVLSGEGADELFGGYLIYREPTALRPFEYIPAPIKQLLRSAAKVMPERLPGRNYILRGTTPLEQRFLGNAKIFSEEMKALILQRPERLAHYRKPFEITSELYEKTSHLDPVSRMQYVDLNLWLPGDILMKADKMTMAHSLEVRTPFLDKEMFELASKIPAEYRIAGGTTKFVFRKAMEGIIPDFILNRPKLGFPVPLRDWLKTKRGEIIQEELKGSGIKHIFNMEAVDRMFQRHRNGQGDYSRMLWVIYIFGLWHQQYMEEQPDVRSETGTA